MKAYEIISAGFGLAGESFDDYSDKELAQAWLNVAIAECMRTENLIRAKEGRACLETCPKVESTSDDVDFSWKICRVCLPFAVAACLFTDRENEYMSTEFRKRFESSLKSCGAATEFPVEDYYPGGEFL